MIYKGKFLALLANKLGTKENRLDMLVKYESFKKNLENKYCNFSKFF